LLLFPIMTNSPDPSSAPLIPRSSRARHAAWRIWLARGIAVGADATQIALTALYPAAYIWGDVIDVPVAVALTFLVGWHIAFIPSFLIKLIPVADVAPTWTIAIAIATWPKKSPPPAK
jgi:hypothetical protein